VRREARRERSALFRAPTRDRKTISVTVRAELSTVRLDPAGATLAIP